jgi:hypothetical protein
MSDKINIHRYTLSIHIFYQGKLVKNNKLSHVLFSEEDEFLKDFYKCLRHTYKLTHRKSSDNEPQIIETIAWKNMGKYLHQGFYMDTELEKEAIISSTTRVLSTIKERLCKDYGFDTNMMGGSMRIMEQIS